MTTTRDRAIAAVIKEVQEEGVLRVTKYLAEDLTIKATRVICKGARKTDPIELRVCIGQPNYKERRYIKLLKEAGEPFPVKKVIIHRRPNQKKKRG